MEPTGDQTTYLAVQASRLQMDELHPNSPLLSFYRNGGADHKGRTLDAILAESDPWLEQTHDYVQWLFPLGSQSVYNPDAPTLDAMAVRAFAESC